MATFSGQQETKLLSTPAKYFWYHQPPPADVEMTGYALMSYLKRKELIKDTIKIVKWLSKQRNYYGGFSSTQVCLKINDRSRPLYIYALYR